MRKKLWELEDLLNCGVSELCLGIIPHVLDTATTINEEVIKNSLQWDLSSEYRAWIMNLVR